MRKLISVIILICVISGYGATYFASLSSLMAFAPEASQSVMPVSHLLSKSDLEAVIACITKASDLSINVWLYWPATTSGEEVAITGPGRALFIATL